MTEPAYDPTLTAWAQEARDLADVAEQLVRTSFVPMSFKKKGDKWREKDVVVAEVVAAILAGKEVGLMPMAALRSIQIIHDTPALTALAMRGLVQSQGHEVWVVEQSESKAVVCGQRRGSVKEHKSTWTLDRARKMNLAEKAQWRSQPQAMLVARATAECCRLTASDVLLGLPYSVEELSDLDERAEEETPKKRTARRRPLEVVEETPTPELEPPAPADDGGPVTAEEELNDPWATPPPDEEG